jgi:hypothetical protein
MTDKIRSAGSPLIKDHENWLKIRGLDKSWNVLRNFGFLGERSEKGSTRKYTENRVTRWAKMFLGEYWILR